MRRVAVTGLGAVTPLGNDAPSTWRAAVAGESGIDFIKSFDPSEFPVRVAAEVKDFDASGLVNAKEARRLDRNVLLALAAAVEAKEDAGLQRLRPGARRRRPRVGDRRLHRDHGAERGHERAGPDPRLPVLHPERARRLRERPGRDLTRPARPELRACLGLRDRLPRRRRRGGDHPPGRRGRDPGRRHRGLHAPPDPGGVLCDARAGRRGRASAAGLASIRRDPGRLRDGGGGLRPPARGSRCGAGARRQGLRGSPRLRRLERRVPHGRARSCGGRSCRDDARRPRARAREPNATWTT